MGSSVLHRVLVLEPHPAVIEDYRITLGQADLAGRGKSFQDKSFQGGSISGTGEEPSYELVFAETDEEALEAVCKAVEEGEGFSVAFIDPGQAKQADSVQTASGPASDENRLKFLTKLRAADPALPLVVVSAGWHADPVEVCRRVPPAEHLYFLQKPFHGREVQQLAMALTARPARRRAKAAADSNGRAASAKLLATSLAGVLVFDSLDRLQASNGAMRTLFPELAECLEPGTSFEELQREIATRLLPSDTLFRTEAWVKERLKRHGTGGGLFEQRFSGGRWVMIGECVLENGETHCHYYDITDLKRRQVSDAAAARLRQVGQSLGAFHERLETDRKAREAEQAEREESNDRVVPISAAWTKAWQREEPAPAIDSVLANKVRAASERQVLSPESCDLNQLLGSHLGESTALAPQETRVEVIEGAGLWPVLIDPQKLAAALRELVLNACEAMEKKGCITIETANRRLDRHFTAARSGLAAGDYVCLSVRDTGAGMSPEMRDRAFNPFFTSKGEAYLGLGLSVVHGFVRQSGGYVEIQPGPEGRGASVEIYLPRLRTEVEDDKQAAGGER